MMAVMRLEIVATRTDTRAMKPSFAVLVAALLMATACRKPPPPATSIIRDIAAGPVSIARATLVR